MEHLSEIFDIVDGEYSMGSPDEQLKLLKKYLPINVKVKFYLNIVTIFHSLVRILLVL